MSAPEATSDTRRALTVLRHLQPLTLVLAGGDDAGEYGSLVLDFLPGEEIVVGVPMVHGEEIPVPVATRLTVRVSAADGLRVFDAPVVRRRELPSPCLYLGWPGEVRRIQRRNDVRVEVMTPVTLRVPAQAEGAEGDGERVVQAITSDLSMGGARLLLGELLEVGGLVTVQLRLPEEEAVEATARVLRQGDNPRAGASRRYWAALQFEELPRQAQRQLTRYLFDVQRDQLRRGAH